jgi:hypothetical protein
MFSGRAAEALVTLRNVADRPPGLLDDGINGVIAVAVALDNADKNIMAFSACGAIPSAILRFYGSANTTRLSPPDFDPMVVPPVATMATYCLPLLPL